MAPRPNEVSLMTTDDPLFLPILRRIRCAKTPEEVLESLKKVREGIFTNTAQRAEMGNHLEELLFAKGRQMQAIGEYDGAMRFFFFAANDPHHYKADEFTEQFISLLSVDSQDFPYCLTPESAQATTCVMGNVVRRLNRKSIEIPYAVKKNCRKICQHAITNSWPEEYIKELLTIAALAISPNDVRCHGNSIRHQLDHYNGNGFGDVSMLSRCDAFLDLLRNYTAHISTTPVERQGNPEVHHLY